MCETHRHKTQHTENKGKIKRNIEFQRTFKE